MKLDTTLRTIMGWPSYVIKNDVMELCLTQQGGNMAPVTFFTDTETPAMPYYFSPWQMEGLPPSNDYMDMFRGDFLCLPFATGGGKDAPFHGETCARKWELDSCEKDGGITELKLFMDMKVPQAHVGKSMKLIDGHNAVYICHSVSGLDGQYTYSHHATISISPDNEGIISMSPTLLGYTANPPGQYNVRESSYNFLEGGRKIESMEKVPTIWKDPAYVDCSHVPAAAHFSGATQFISKTIEGVPAWTCVYFPKGNYVWFAMKNPKRQPVTHFWLEFSGRFQYPWNGRTMCFAVEDMGIGYNAEMRERMSERVKFMEEAGIKTDFRFNPDETVNVNYLQGAAQVPEGFGKVRDIKFLDGEIELASESGKTQKAPLDWKHVLKD